MNRRAALVMVVLIGACGDPSPNAGTTARGSAGSSVTFLAIEGAPATVLPTPPVAAVGDSPNWGDAVPPDLRAALSAHDWYLSEVDGAPRVDAPLSSIRFGRGFYFVDGDDSCNFSEVPDGAYADGTITLIDVVTTAAYCGWPSAVSLSPDDQLRLVDDAHLELTRFDGGPHRFVFVPTRPFDALVRPLPPVVEPPVASTLLVRPTVPKVLRPVPGVPAQPLVDVVPTDVLAGLVGLRFKSVAFDGFPWIGLHPPEMSFAEGPGLVNWTLDCATYIVSDGWYDSGDIVIGPSIEGPLPVAPVEPSQQCLGSGEYALRLGDRLRFGDGGTRIEVHRDDGRDGPFEFQQLDLPLADPAVIVGTWNNGLLPVEFRSDGTMRVTGCLEGTWVDGVLRLPRPFTDCWSPPTAEVHLVPGLPGDPHEGYQILAGGTNDVIYLTSYSTSLRLLRAG